MAKSEKKPQNRRQKLYQAFVSDLHDATRLIFPLIA